MAHKPKIGRRATSDDRQIAADWVELYRKAMASPNGSYCLNPDDPLEEQTYLHADNVEFLLSLLSDFSETGTFKRPNSPMGAHFILRWDFDALRAKGMTHENAVEMLADKNACSTRTIERRLTDKS